MLNLGRLMAAVQSVVFEGSMYVMSECVPDVPPGLASLGLSYLQGCCAAYALVMCISFF